MGKRKYVFLIFCFIFVVLFGCNKKDTVFISEENDVNTESSSTSTQETVTKQTESIYVYVCGYVEKPGVYELKSDARICDALELAGGVLEDGKPEALNQAEHMTDGQTLYVPGKQEEAEVLEASEDGLVNINTANKDELMTLPGIGESKAELILEYRNEHGAFQSIENLMDIQGIKEGVFNKIKDAIKV